MRATWQGDGRLQCGKIIHEEYSHWPSDTTNGYLIHLSNTYTRTSVPQIILKTFASLSLARFPESVQLHQLLVGGTQQVFWLIAPFVQPSQFAKNQWLVRIWTSDCESQQRDCAGLSPASLTLNAVQRYNKKCTYARKRTLFYKKIIDFYLFVPFYLTMGACLQ